MSCLQEAGDYDLVLCDLMMPEVSGMQLADEIARVKPGLAKRMVFMTGGAFSDDARDFVESADTRVLEKPLSAQEIRDCVADVTRLRPPAER